ncbi:hypothetical protein ACE1ET_02435 [Saccharicrinis sp. FJH62]|uniref:hypothetical protein n=1 Tax=Saccharicrinis sp. FJH62 TaxID=3344657 RepID=UPI0035D48FC6
MKKEVIDAIHELQEAYGEDNIEVKPDGNGGALIVVKNIDIGDKFIPSKIWCGFHINHMYPMSDVYPHFVNSDLQFNGGSDLKGPYQKREWNARNSIQVSRRSKRWNPALDTALLKLEKVIQFIRES